MPDCARLLEYARNNPAGLRFSELCQLAECYGFVFDRQVGSHRQYKRRGVRRLVNLQDDHGMAKSYQVRQVLRVIASLADAGSKE